MIRNGYGLFERKTAGVRVRLNIPIVVLALLALLYSSLWLLANSGNAGLRDDLLARAGLVVPETVEQAARLLDISSEPGAQNKALRLHERQLAQNAASVYQWMKTAHALSGVGDDPMAWYAVATARQLGKSVAPAQMEAVHFYVAAGVSDAVLETGKHVLELVPYYDSFLFRYYQQLGVTPEEMLSRGLPDGPRAVSSLLGYSIESKDAVLAKQTWAKMSASGWRTQAGVGAYSKFLLAAGQPGQAWSVWQSFYELRQAPGGIFNPGFERDPVDGPFDWHWTELPGVETKITSTEAHTGRRSLEIAFGGERNVDYAQVISSVVAGPGSYSLKAYVKSDGITTNQGVGLELRDSERLIAASEPLTGTSDWHPVSLLFHLPEVRWLTLGLARHPSVKFDNKIAGRFWLDDVSIERVGP